jgi:hypothetical protein
MAYKLNKEDIQNHLDNISSFCPELKGMVIHEFHYGIKRKKIALAKVLEHGGIDAQTDYMEVSELNQFLRGYSFKASKKFDKLLVEPIEAPKEYEEIPFEVEVSFIDMSGKIHTLIVKHDGTGDCWDGLEYATDKDGNDVAFDINTYINDKEFCINVFQCTEKNNDVWSMYNNKLAEIISFKIIDK